MDFVLSLSILFSVGTLSALPVPTTNPQKWQIPVGMDNTTMIAFRAMLNDQGEPTFRSRWKSYVRFNLGEQSAGSAGSLLKEYEALQKRENMQGAVIATLALVTLLIIVASMLAVGFIYKKAEVVSEDTQRYSITYKVLRLKRDEGF